MQATAFVVSLLGGFIPALFWLWFWLREDKARPEPKALIASAFIAGIAVVTITLPLQKYALDNFSGDISVFGATIPLLLCVWVVIEEVLKYAAALIVVLWNKAVDEPIDTIIYMISIALGFSAFENALFIFNPFMDGRVSESLLTGHFRFLGATLLHVLASGTVGAMMALAFYKPKLQRIFWSTIGLCIAIVLHVLFNYFIMDASGETILTVFLFVWMGVIILFLVFEKVKLIERAHLRR